MYKIIGANSAEYGPVSAEQLRQWINEGRVNAETLAQAAGETGWKPISTYPDFADVFAPKPASPPPTLGKAPPTFTAGAASVGSREAALSEVSGPAIGLIVVGALTLVGGGFGILRSLFWSAAGSFPSTNFPGQDPQVRQFAQMFGGTVGVAVAVLQMALGAFYIFGGINMKALQKYGLCMTASIIALLPCFGSCCCIGIPFGIWALVVLNKPEVKAHFS